ncbi:MAG: RNA polymerase sigma factor, partial [Chloroflexi bacterium]|nr:RNA polymerase sigma factor [Chloroflexota bacterium]
EPASKPVNIDSDGALARQAAKNPQAFSELYERHVNRIYRYVLARVGDVQDAQDVTSQTLLTALEQLPRYRGQGVFVAWLMGIARHKVIDYYRQRRPALDLEEIEDLPGSNEDTGDIVDQQLALEAIARKLKVIAPDRAEALSLRLFGGLEVAEIAEVMGKNEAAVRMLVFRGLRDLQAQLDPGQEELR